MSNWNEARIQKYIDDEIEENHRLDYKAADSLQKSPGKKKEITKDVSAMANSDGGVIIYGLAEFQEKDKAHLPKRVDHIDRTVISKEWLEHVVNNIRPRIDGVVIHSVSISSENNGVVYIVEIPKSDTAHQATDNRYYKRFNFESVPMEDYEVRDVMNREKAADLDLMWNIQTQQHHQDDRKRLILRPFVTSKNLISSEHGVLKITITFPLKFVKPFSAPGLIIENTGLPLPGYEAIPHATMTKYRWGSNLNGAVFPGDWHNFNGLNKIVLEYPYYDEDETFLLLAELFTANSTGRKVQHQIECPKSNEPTISIVAHDEYDKVVGIFWATYNRAQNRRS